MIGRGNEDRQSLAFDDIKEEKTPNKENPGEE